MVIIWASVMSTAAAVACDRSETFLMMRTLRDMNMSKFVAEDVPVFLSLIEDLFPGMKAERNAFETVTAALIKVRVTHAQSLCMCRVYKRLCRHKVHDI